MNVMFDPVAAASVPSFLDPSQAPPAAVAFLTSWRLAALVLVLLALVLGGSGLGSLLARDRRRHGPALRRLAHAAGVSAPDRRTLERAAVRAGVSTPVAMLISRGCFDAAMVRAGVVGEDRVRLARVRRQVFGEPAGELPVRSGEAMARPG